MRGTRAPVTVAFKILAHRGVPRGVPTALGRMPSLATIAASGFASSIALAVATRHPRVQSVDDALEVRAGRSNPSRNEPRSVRLVSNTTLLFVIAPESRSALSSCRSTDCTSPWLSR